MVSSTASRRSFARRPPSPESEKPPGYSQETRPPAESRSCSASRTSSGRSQFQSRETWPSGQSAVEKTSSATDGTSRCNQREKGSTAVPAMGSCPFGVSERRSEEHTSALQSPHVISYPLFCL